MGKIFCTNCNKELEENERPCSVCGCETGNHKITPTTGSLTIKGGGYRLKHKRPDFKRPFCEKVSRFKKSKDPKLMGQEVYEECTVDRINKRWHQIIKDVSTGEIIHLEDKSLEEKQS